MLITVIIPVYNTEKYLRQCVESVLGQSMPDFELLLVNDGSSDASGAICDEYAAQDDRIRVFHTDNRGVSAARNLALDSARGEFVTFVDSDDWIAPERLERLISSSIGESGIAFANTTRVQGDERRDFVMGDSRAEGSRAACVPVLARLVRDISFSFTWCKLFSRATIERLGLRFEEGCDFAEDEIFTMQYCRHITHISTDSRPSYYYRILPDSLIHRHRTPAEFLEVEMVVYRRYLEQGYNDELLYAKTRFLLSRLKQMLRHRDGELDDWNSEISRKTIRSIREVWTVYTRCFRWRYLSDGRDWQYATLGRVIFTPPSDRWLKLMIRTLSI